MRTTVSLPDDLFQDLQPYTAGGGFDQLVCEALQSHLERLEDESLVQAMAEGYREEARASSLDVGWSEIETEGWL